MDRNVDVLGYQPVWKGVYTQFALIYPTTKDVSLPNLSATLQYGLDQLSQTFPWTAGQVITLESSPGISGLPKIVEYLESIPIIVKDRRDEAGIPSLEELRQADYPFNMLDERWVCPRNTLPTMGEKSEDIDPCVMIPVNLIAGGLVIAVLTNHQVLDGTGQGFLMHLLNKACRNEAYAEEELEIGSRSLLATIPLLHESYHAGAEVALWTGSSRVPQPEYDHERGSPSQAKWTYFVFDAHQLRAIKDEAMETKLQESRFVSTDDALTAFLWRSVMRVRQRRIKLPALTHMTRPVDIRTRFDIHPQYPSILQYFAFSESDVEKLTRASIGQIAAEMRSLLQAPTSTLKYDTQAFATLLH